MKLRIDFEDWEGNQKYIEYPDFAIGCEGENYKLLSTGRGHGFVG